MSYLTPKFRIFVTLADGREVEAFTWTRGAEEGIRRALREAPRFGFDAVSARAEAIGEAA